MSILQSVETETNVNLPKFTETTFILRNGYYVVTNGELFNYYSILIEPAEDSSPILRFKKSPPVLLEGYVLVSKKIYLVTLQDLQRRIVRKSREIKRETLNANSTDTSTDTRPLSTILGASGSAAVSLPDNPSTGHDASMEESEAANLAWEDQIGALLRDPFEEEDEWEVEDNPQS